jgi:flagellar biosynthesis protein FlhF
MTNNALVKNFFGSTHEETIKKIEEEVGKGYSLLETRKKRSFPNFWDKKYHYKILIKEPEAMKQTLQMDQMNVSYSEYPVTNQVPDVSMGESKKDELLNLLRLKEQTFGLNNGSNQGMAFNPTMVHPTLVPQQMNPMVGRTNSSSESSNNGENEIQDLKNMMSSIMQQMGSQGDSIFNEKEDKLLIQFYDYLIDSEIEREVAIEIINEIKEESDKADLKDMNYIKKKLRKKVTSKIKVSGPLEEKDVQTIALIGPTGVGKTTTLAKIAAILQSKDKKVGLITTDDFRLGAINQIQQYADILKTHKAVIAKSPEELTSAIEYFKYRRKMDYILVDTSGRNPMDKGLINEIKEYLSIVKPDHTSLVLSSVQKYSDMEKTLKNYKSVKVDSLVFTKLDETMSYGFLLNVMNQTDLNISYITNGQDVPLDIELATKENITNRVLNGVDTVGSS